MIDMTMKVHEQPISLGNFIDEDEHVKPKVSLKEYVAYKNKDKCEEGKCPKCANSPKPGWWWHRIHREWSTCGRCGGTGVVTAIDAKRFEAYTGRKESGKVMDHTYLTHLKAVHNL